MKFLLNAAIRAGEVDRRWQRGMQPRGGGDRTVRKGPWTAEEDEVLLQHVREHGPREWSSIRSKGLLPRTGKSCRLRWVNKLRPNLKTGCKFSPEEERVVIDLQAQFGNKWAKIATYLPGRTDNDVKNFWSTRQKRLARILRAPLPRRKSGKQNNGSAATAPSHVLPTSKDPWPGMNPFQETMHNIGQSSQEACMENQCADAPFPAGLLDPESILPSSIEFAVDAAAECSSYNAAPAAYLSFGDAGDPASVVDPAVFVDVASADGNVAYLDPIPEVQPALFFGLEEDDYGHVAPVHQDLSDVMFDDLPPDMFDFLELPPSPPPLPPPPPTSPSTHL